MQQVKSMLDTLKKSVSDKLKFELELAQQKLDQLKSRIEGMSEFAALDAQKKKEIQSAFEAFNNDFSHQTLIAVVKDTLRRFEEDEYGRLLQKIAVWSQPEIVPGPDGNGTVHESAIEYVKCSSVTVAFDKPYLANEEDLNRYMEALKAALAHEIKSGKRIQI